jgi:hypothetical protein
MRLLSHVINVAYAGADVKPVRENSGMGTVVGLLLPVLRVGLLDQDGTESEDAKAAAGGIPPWMSSRLRDSIRFNREAADPPR